MQKGKITFCPIMKSLENALSHTVKRSLKCTTHFSCAAELFYWVQICHPPIMFLFPMVLDMTLKNMLNNSVRLKPYFQRELV